MRFRVISAKKRSTMLSQDAEVGVKCKVEARVCLEPAFHGRGLMRGIVVDDEMKVETVGGLSVNQLEKAQELPVPMAWHARPDDLAVQHVECCKQRRGAVALIVVGHGSGAALLHRQAGLGAVEGLDLALFVDAENQRLVRRIEIEPDHILDLRGEVLVARDLERLDQMRLQPVRTPDPLDAAVGDACCRRHAAPAPMGCIRRFLVQRHMHHLLDLLRAQWLDARRPGCVLQKPVHSLGHIAAAPAAHREQALAHGRRNRFCRQPVAGQQHDPRPPNHLLGRVPVADQPLQSFTISAADRNSFDRPHRRRLAGLRRFVNRSSASEH